jgi:hypothetical protein
MRLHLLLRIAFARPRGYLLDRVGDLEFHRMIFVSMCWEGLHRHGPRIQILDGFGKLE